MKKIGIILLMLCSISAVYAQKKGQPKPKQDNGIPKNFKLPPSPPPVFAPPPPFPSGDLSALGSIMPPFLVVTLDTIKENGKVKKPLQFKQYTHNDVKKDGNLLVVIFNPLCDHCEHETEMLEQNLNSFVQSDLVMMVSPQFKDYLDGFNKKMHVSQFPTLKVGVDSLGFIKKTILYDQLPQLNVYNKDRILIKTFTGQIPFDSIRNYVN
jgi:thiol-disulfide isomerase/thioredoxin